MLSVSAGLLVCTAYNAPKHVLAAVLAITGLGFGPSSMAFFLSAQNAVSWQRRGIVTSSVQFVRTAGGSLGIGILGTIFNIITLPKLATLESANLTSATFLDPRLRRSYRRKRFTPPAG